MTTYRVTGQTAYAGHQPGEEFEADLDELAERRALDRGAIEVARKHKAKKEEEASDE